MKDQPESAVPEPSDANEPYYRRLFDTLPVATFACDRNAVIQHYNQQAVVLWGREPERGVEKHCGSIRLWLPDGRPLAHEHSPIVDVLKTGIPAHDVDVMVERPDGRRLPVVASFTALTDATGDIVGAVTCFYDATVRTRAESLQRGQRHVLDLITDDRPLAEVLHALVEMIEAQSTSGMIGSILLTDTDGVHLRYGAGPSLPPDYNAAIDGIVIGPVAGSCGTAAFLRKPIHVSNIQTDPLWLNYRDLATTHGLAACWSTPILSSSGELLGTFAMYYRDACAAHDDDLKLVDVVTRTAAIAIERGLAATALRQRSAQFETLLAAAPLGVYLVDSDFRIREVNPTAIPVFGNIPDLVGRHFDEVIRRLWPRDVADEVMGRFRRTLETGEPYVTPELIETRLDRGVTEYYEWQIHRIPLPDGRFGVVCYFRDISRQVLARSAIADSEQRWRFMAESMPQKIFTAAPNGDVDYFNHQWMTFTGLSFEQIAQWGWVQFIHPDDLEENLRRWRHSIDTGDDFECEHRFRRHDGIYHWHLSRARARRGADGEVLSWIGSNTDIDDAKRLLEELKAANRVKDDFLATLSHELRTPLNAVLGWAHMLRDSRLPSHVHGRAIEAIARNAKAQATLVDDLLDVSRIMAGKLDIKSEVVDLSEVVDGAMETIRLSSESKSLRVTTSPHPIALVQVTGDADRLRQVVWNLLSNAVKFTPVGGTIDVAIFSDDSSAFVRVRDSGQGIPAEFLPHVFDRFRQADSTSARAHGGLGLGLAIARHVMEAHGGIVTVESEGQGKGATFTARLPIRVAVPVAKTRVTPADRHETTTLTDARALIVDDEPDARELLAAILAERGMRVTTAASADDALAILHADSFDVLLCDIGMPGKDGYALIQAVRTLPVPGAGQIPAIAVTAYASQTEHDAAVQAGFNWHIGKPVEPDHLVAVVCDAIDRARL